ncbi:MAG TPA: dienelactone hydrolase family protein [Ktedonobacteraceae bacterium]|jgi:carboxymethylenebutenolidase|nr:dienelactone hydrolase family protein [Ktedonobacteraceae bacterium]
MCYDNDARPPVPPVSGSARGEDLVLTGADGNRFAAYVAHPEKPTGAQIVIFPDVRGLHQFYKELAIRFGETGTTAIAIDYFGRTAGTGPRDDSFEFWPHVQQMQAAGFEADTNAAFDYLRQGEGANRPIFTVGFCMGGTLSFLVATRPLGLAGAIGFYAGLTRALPAFGGVTLLQQAANIKFPVLGLFGGADQGIPVSDVETFNQELHKAGIEHSITIYPEAPHSFFDRRADQYAEASADAWQRVLAFIAAHSRK